MGCDIHVYSETKVNGVWVFDDSKSMSEEEGWVDASKFKPASGRDYWFFGALNSVRCVWEWSRPQTYEIPNDVSSDIAKLYEQWKGDAHSESSMTRAEVKQEIEKLKRICAQELIAPTDYKEAVNHCLERYQKVLSGLNVDVPDENQRIVFWFDN